MQDIPLRLSVSLVNLSPVSSIHHQDDKPSIIYPVDNAVIAHTQSQQTLMSFQLFDVRSIWQLGNCRCYTPPIGHWEPVNKFFCRFFKDYAIHR